MNVFSLIREKLKHNIPDEELIAKAQNIANEVGLDLDRLYNPKENTYDDANVKFIAEEIDKLQESAITLNASNVALETTNKKPKKLSTKLESSNTGSANESIQKLIPVVTELRETIADQATAMKHAVRKKVEKERDSVVQELIELTNNLPSDIVRQFTEKLKEGSDDTRAFLSEFETAFDEAWGD